MLPGEYAVLYSFEPAEGGASAPGTAAGPTCTIFSTLAEAEEHAAAQVLLHPALRCRIYTEEGLGRPPVREICGEEHQGDSELSASFRRWAGSILFFGGLVLIVLDWSHDFRLSWPATIGARALPVGLILLLTECVILYGTKRRAAQP